MEKSVMPVLTLIDSICRWNKSPFYNAWLLCYNFSLSFQVELTLYYTMVFIKQQIFRRSKLSAFADNKLKMNLREKKKNSGGLKTLREKEKMLVTSIFSFSHNIFKRLLFRILKSRCGKGLTNYTTLMKICCVQFFCVFMFLSIYVFLFFISKTI